jgi:flagellar motor switch protein FliN
MSEDQETAAPLEAEAAADTGVSAVELEEFAPAGPRPLTPGAAPGFGRVMDVSVNVSARIGVVRKTISDVLELSPGAVIDLEKNAGDPVDLVIGEKLIARGEIVVVDDHYGLRITEVITED